MSTINSSTSVGTTDRTPERTLGQLVVDATNDVSSIVRSEITLAKAEISADAKVAGKGAGMFGGAGVLGFLGLVLLLFAAVYGLVAAGLPVWLSFLIVAVVLFVVAGVLALVGKQGDEQGQGQARAHHRHDARRRSRRSSPVTDVLRPLQLPAPRRHHRTDEHRRVLRAHRGPVAAPVRPRPRGTLPRGRARRGARWWCCCTGFPQFWWAWRHQLTGLADAGYRVAAMDLRGYGASDKPPRGYDTFTLAADVASVIRSLGESQAAVVGHGWGGWIAWSMPTMQPAVTRAVAALSMPHPLVLRRASFTSPAQIRLNGYLGGLQRPFVPEHQMTSGPAYVQRLLRAWAAPGGGWPTPDVAQRYADAMALPFVAHSAAEYYRWVVRSQVRPDGRRFVRRVQAPGAGAGDVPPRATVTAWWRPPARAARRLRLRPVRGARARRRGTLPAGGGTGRRHRPPRPLARPAGLSAGRRTWLSPRRSRRCPRRWPRSGPASAPAPPRPA